MSDKIRVFIADDTVIYRKILSDAVAALPDAEVVGIASNGAMALKKLAQVDADLALLDVFMPEMNGVETLRGIRKDFPSVAVVMISGATNRDADITIEALELGALDFIPKPTGMSQEESLQTLTDDLRRIFRLLNIRRWTRNAPSDRTATVATTPKPFAHSPPPTAPSGSRPTSFEIVVIGVSTGGPNALNAVIPKLPGDLGCPILLVQHMPPCFTASLADHLARQSALAVREAKDRETVLPNTVYIAPGGRHMIVRPFASGPAKLQISLNDTPPVNSCRPAVDVLFRSVAANVQGGVLSVILTGMGEDGAAGVATLKRRGCYSLAQDEKTCVVYGMPRAIIEKGLADEALPLEDIAERITALVKNRITPIHLSFLPGK